MMLDHAVLAGATLGTSATYAVLQVIEDNGSAPSIGVQGTLLGAAVSVGLYLERKARKIEEIRDNERKEAMTTLARENQLLREQVEKLTQRLWEQHGPSTSER